MPIIKKEQNNTVDKHLMAPPEISTPSIVALQAQINALTTIVQQISGTVTPGGSASLDALIGQIAYFPLNVSAAEAAGSAPSGWLILNGDLISKTGYSKLWNWVSTQSNFGKLTLKTTAEWILSSNVNKGYFCFGDATNFRLPDLMGKTTSRSVTIKCGNSSGVYGPDANQNHNHTATTATTLSVNSTNSGPGGTTNVPAGGAAPYIPTGISLTSIDRLGVLDMGYYMTSGAQYTGAGLYGAMGGGLPYSAWTGIDTYPFGPACVGAFYRDAEGNYHWDFGPGVPGTWQSANPSQYYNGMAMVQFQGAPANQYRAPMSLGTIQVASATTVAYNGSTETAVKSITMVPCIYAGA